MTLTAYGRSFKMTAANDERTGVLFINTITFAVTGGAAADHLVLSDSSGAVLVDRVVTAANDHGQLLQQPICAQGLKFTTAPTGTVSVIVNLE